MALTHRQKKFIREHHQKMTVKKMAKKLEVRPKDVRRALRELGLDHAPDDDGSLAKPEKKTPAWAAKLAPVVEALKRYRVALPLVLGLALVLRMVHLIAVSDSPFFLHLHTDPFMYHHWALQIVEGDWAGAKNPVFYLGPAYPYFLAVVYKIFGPSTMAACVIQALLSTASAGLVYHLGRRMFGPVTGLIAGLFAAGYAMFIFYSGLILGATLIIFLDLCMLTFLVSGLQQPRWYKWVLAGVFLGLSATARGNVLLFAPLAVLAIMAFFGFRAWKKWLPPAGILAAATLVTIAPVTLHNAIQGGDFVLLTANAGANFFIGNNAHSDGIYMRNARYKNQPMGLSVRDQQASFPAVARKELGREDLKPSEVSRFWVGKTFEEIGAHWNDWLALLGNKLKYFVNAYEVPNNRNIYFSSRFSAVLRLPLFTFGLLIPLGLVGLAVSIRGWRKRGMLIAFFLAHLAALLLFFVNARYRLIVAPVVIIYAAALVRWLFLKVKKKNYAIAGGVAACLVVGYILAYLPVPEINYRANFLNLANAYRDLDQPEQALENYDEALKISPGFYYAMFKKGQVLAKLGRTDQAEFNLHQALKLARGNNDHLNVQRIQAELKRLKGKIP